MGGSAPRTWRARSRRSKRKALRLPDEVVATPSPGAALLRAAGFTLGETPETFDAIRDGLRFLEGQRRIGVCLAPGQPEVHSVGVSCSSRC